MLMLMQEINQGTYNRIITYELNNRQFATNISSYSNL